MKDNPNRRKAIIWGIVALLAIFATFAPLIPGMEDFAGGYPDAFGFLILDSISIILMLHYVQQTRLLGRILKDDNLLAHWIYSREEWDRYAETDYRAANKANRVWYYTCSAHALLFGILGILFFVFKRESMGLLFIILFCIFALIASARWFSAWYNYRRNRKYLGEAYITHDAVYLNRRLETWCGSGRELDAAFVADNESQPLLVIIYSDDQYRRGWWGCTIRVPVPRGQEKAAEEIAEKLNLMK